MKYLLDTHAFLWWVTDDPQLSNRARNIVEDSSITIYFSAVSAWEIAIKHGIGRLQLDDSPKRFVNKQLEVTGFPVLEIRLDHVLEVSELPLIHADPFDRVLIAQCACDRLTILSRNKTIGRYPIEAYW